MLQSFLDYLAFWSKATNAHGIHSPFVFQLYNEVIKADKEYYCFEAIDQMRNELLRDNKILNINDLGATSKVFKSKERKLKSIVKYATSPPKTAQLLFKLVDFFSPTTLLELGTSVGLASLHIAEAMPTEATLYTLEGDEALMQIAQKNFQSYFQSKHSFPYTKKVKFVLGNIDDTLEKQVNLLEKIDFVFFDANHQKKATLRYFETCLSKIDENSVFIFDDIYWSAEMKEAWHEIIAHPKVSISIDLFELGIVSFRQKQPKQHFWLK